MQRFATENVVMRLWNQDATLWPAEEHELKVVKSNLHWLDLPNQIKSYIDRVLERTSAAQHDGLDQFVFVGMGSSNLAVACILSLREEAAYPHVHLLDTTDPEALNRLRSKLLLDRTLIIFTHKSGKRLETHALLLHFLEKLKEAGIAVPGTHFVALTEEGSYLADLAVQYRFRDVFFDPPGIHGRYSGLIHFSLLLTAVCRLDEVTVMNSVLKTTAACRLSTNIQDNPAATLGSLLAAAEPQGLNRVMFLTSDPLRFFAYRISQLLAISNGVHNRGFVPIFGKSAYSLKILRRKCVVATLAMSDELDDLQNDAHLPQLRELGVPVVKIELNGPADLAAEIFK